ncbi:MAG: NERD domain-containing protein [Acidimicrobiia bacterium]|nr:NERD domain-containing protein [Acidimicrobiia bacterium]
MAVRFAPRQEQVHLDALEGTGAIVLHDQSVPGSAARAERVVVAPSGIWVITTKHFDGQVQKRDVGTFFSMDWRLYVGRRDVTRLLGAASRTARALRSAICDDDCAVPVLPVLCLPEAEWSWFAKPFQMCGVVVASPNAVLKLVAQPGAFGPDDLDRLADELRAA